MPQRPTHARARSADLALALSALATAAFLPGCSCSDPKYSCDPSAVTTQSPPAGDLRFIAWADTKSGTYTLGQLSCEAMPLGARLTLFSGDLESDGFTRDGSDRFRSALDAEMSNGTFCRTFAVRGNHDAHDPGGWQRYWDIRGHAAAVGATNFRALTENLTYSFDVGPVHFVGMDVPGDVTVMTADEVAWLEADLGDAEARGAVHSFLFWHGPIYPIAEHCCSASKPELLAVLNRHPSVSASFHGHEHVNAWAHLDGARDAALTRGFEQIVAGRAGAENASCRAERVDFCQDRTAGFVLVDVTGASFMVSFYALGESAPVLQRTFTKP